VLYAVTARVLCGAAHCRRWCDTVWSWRCLYLSCVCVICVCVCVREGECVCVIESEGVGECMCAEQRCCVVQRIVSVGGTLCGAGDACV